MERKLVFEILEELIKINTTNPPGNEKNAVEYLLQLFSGYDGINTDLQDLGNNRANLIASYGGTGPELIFCGHLDVVPAAGNWTSPAFCLTRRSGRLYGRGAADMKSGVAAMSAVLISLAKEKRKLHGKLKLVLVSDEEFSNLGMRHFLKKEVNACFAVIGEPTELQVCTAHRGVLRDWIDVEAKPYHAALSERSGNAVTYAAEAVLSLFHLNEKLERYTHELLRPPGIAVTKIEGYENDNIVPGKVRLLTDFRILPGMSFEECRNLEEQALSGIGRYQINTHFYMPGGEISRCHPYVKMCCKIGEELLQREQKPAAFGASCEQCFLTGRGIPTVICGPGSLKQAHIIDEYVEEEQVWLAELYYQRIAEKVLRR